MDTTHDLQTTSGFRGRLDTWKSRGLTKVHDLQRVVADRGTMVRTGAKSQVTKVQDSMRGNPMKWAGLAAATGFALGLAGRIKQVRNQRKHTMPTLVIVETSC